MRTTTRFPGFPVLSSCLCALACAAILLATPALADAPPVSVDDPMGSSVSSLGLTSMGWLGGVSSGQGTHFSPTSVAEASGAETGLAAGDENTGRLDAWFIGSLAGNLEFDGKDSGLNGGIGLTWDTGDEWRFGGGLFANSRDLETNYTGSQQIDAFGPGVFAVYSPAGTGFEFSVNALWQTVDLRLERGYLQTGVERTSTGTTDAEVFGLSGRVQWTTAVTDDVSLTPFAEYLWQSVHMDGYSESEGPTLASFDSRDDQSNLTRLGLQADGNLFDGADTWAWLAWNHRFEDESSSLTGSTTGIASFHRKGSPLDQNWGDMGVGASWQLTERLSATTSLGYAFGCSDYTVPDLTATVGLNWRIW